MKLDSTISVAITGGAIAYGVDVLQPKRPFCFRF